MQIKTFGNKKIIVRKLDKSDLKKAKKFQDFINALVDEDAMLLVNRKITLKNEVKFLENILRGVKSKNRVFLIAEYGKKVIGTVGIELGVWRRNHIGKLGIAVRNNYRGIGLGTQLMAEIIKLAKKDLRPKLKIIQLEVYTNNKPAISLYKKMGFKIVAKLPKQIQYRGKLIDEFIMTAYVQ